MTNDDKNGGENDDDQSRSENDDDKDEECKVVKRHCKTHNIPATMGKLQKRGWTKIMRRELYEYRTRSSVQWQCPKARPEMRSEFTKTEGTSDSNDECSNAQVLLPEIMMLSRENN